VQAPALPAKSNLQVHTIPTRSPACSCGHGHRVTWRCTRGRCTAWCSGRSRSCCGVGGAVVTLHGIVVAVVALLIVVVAAIASRVVSRSWSLHRMPVMLRSWWLSSSHVLPQPRSSSSHPQFLETLHLDGIALNVLPRTA
jgi:hypothetical protein